MKTSRVVVTGIGMLTPNGIGTQDVWENCLAGKVNVQPIPPKWHNYYTPQSTVWSPLPALNPLDFSLTKSELRHMNFSQILSVITSTMALANANILLDQTNAKKNTFAPVGIEQNEFGVFCGTGCGGLTTALEQMEAHYRPVLSKFVDSIAQRTDGNPKVDISEVMSSKRFNPFVVIMTMPSAGSSMTSIKFGAKGPNRTFCAACASSTVALGQAFRSIKQGECQVALSVGTEYMGDNTGSIFRSFDMPGILTRYEGIPEKANRPFDVERSGFLFCEGAAATLVLEDLEHAKQRNAPILAEMIGYAETSDAFSIMAIDSEGSSITRMLDQLLVDCQITANDVDYINCHGTGTHLNDETESRIIASYFGQRPFLNSTKSIVGHSIGASGAIEAAVTVLSLQSSQLHPSANLESPVRPLNWVRERTAAKIEIGITQSFGFGGHNAALGFKKWRES